MNVVGIVFSAEFVRRIKSRPYVIGTVVGAIAIVLVSSLGTIVGSMFGNTKKIIVAGDPVLVAAAKPLLARDFTITGTMGRLDAKPTRAFLDDRKTAAVVDLTRASARLRVVAYVRDPGAFANSLRADLRPLGVALNTGLPVERVEQAADVHVDVRDVSGRFSDANGALAAKGIAYLFVFLLYLAVLFNAQSIVTSVTEEKTSRIAEVLVATVDPARLLAAKVLAAAATGFIQIAVWLGAALLSGRSAASFFGGDETANAATSSAAPSFSAVTISAPEVLWFIAFFIVGFAQCATLFAAVGSLVTRSEDVGSLSGPLYIPIVLAFVVAQLALALPNAPSVVTLSFFPLIAPFVMFTRIAVATVPVWQIALALAINIAAAIFFAWIAGRIYRVGLLMYGRPPSWKQVIAAARQG